MARRYGISAPVRNVESLQRVGAQLKDAVEAILGYRGTLYSGVSLPTPSGPGLDFEKLLEYLEALEQRVQALEVDVAFLFDWVYAHGYTSGTPLLWNPGVASPTDLTRLSVDTISHISYVGHPDNFRFVAVYEADYILSVDLRFEPNQNNRDWTVAPFLNGGQVGPGISFNSRDEPVLQLGASMGAFMNVGDEIDIRLWPTNAGSSGDILVFSFDMEARGVDEDAVN